MKIKNAVTENCTKCSRYLREITPEVFGCDNCRKEIQRNLAVGKRQHLQLTIFQNGGDTTHIELCSWKCVLAYLPKIKSDYFVSLPYLHFDAGYPKEMTAKELIRLLGKK